MLTQTDFTFDIYQVRVMILCSCVLCDCDDLDGSGRWKNSLVLRENSKLRQHG